MISPELEKSIHEAADALVAEGIKPTLAAVRLKLGKGSMNSLSSGMRTWREANEQKPGVVTTPPIPESLCSDGYKMVEAIWKAALEESENALTKERELLNGEWEKFDSEQREYKDVVAAIERDIKITQLENERLTHKAEALSTQVQSRQDEIKELGEELNLERKQHNETKVELGIAQTNVSNLKESSKRLEADLESKNATIAKLNDLSAQSKQDSYEKEALVKQLTKELENTKNALQQAQAETKQAQTEAAKLDVNYQVLMQQASAKDAELTSMRAELAAAKEQVQLLTTEISETRGLLAASEKHVAALERKGKA